MEPFWALPALGQRAEACDRMNAPTANVTRPCFALKQSLQRVGTTSSGRDKRHQTFLCLYLLSRKRFGESILETCDLTALRWTCSQCTFLTGKHWSRSLSPSVRESSKSRLPRKLSRKRQRPDGQTKSLNKMAAAAHVCSGCASKGVLFS